MARKKVALDFEQSLADLQTLVERLENGELSLEDSLTAFEQGIGLTRDCQSALAQAEQKVQVPGGRGCAPPAGARRRTKEISRSASFYPHPGGR